MTRGKPHLPTRPYRAFLAAALAAAVTAAAAPGQTYYFRHTDFEIPFEQQPGSAFSKMHLWSSTDGKTYAEAGSTSEVRGKFAHKAKGEGWHYFVLQVEQRDGRKYPENVNGTPPGLRVCIDTTKPKAYLKQVAARKGDTCAVEWKVEDDNLDLNTLRLRCRQVGTLPWTAMRPELLPYAQFSWTPPGRGRYEVQLSVADQAGNETVVQTQAVVDSTAAFAPAEQGVFKDPGERPVDYVRTKTFNLEYNISGVDSTRTPLKHVEVWQTCHRCAQWSPYPQVAPAVGPFRVTVAKKGIHGFSLVPVKRDGTKSRSSPPPKAGELPQRWVVVDDTPPRLELKDITVGQTEEDKGMITVNWLADDEFFGEKPIRLFWAPKAEGGPPRDWKPLSEDLANDGSQQVKADGPDMPAEFYVKVVATDRAGNTAEKVSKDTVTVDTSDPKAEIKGVKPAESKTKEQDPPME